MVRLRGYPRRHNFTHRTPDQQVIRTNVVVSGANECEALGRAAEAGGAVTLFQYKTMYAVHQPPLATLSGSACINGVALRACLVEGSLGRQLMAHTA